MTVRSFDICAAPVYNDSNRAALISPTARVPSTLPQLLPRLALRATRRRGEQRRSARATRKQSRKSTSTGIASSAQVARKATRDFVGPTTRAWRTSVTRASAMASRRCSIPSSTTRSNVARPSSVSNARIPLGVSQQALDRLNSMDEGIWRSGVAHRARGGHVNGRDRLLGLGDELQAE